MDFLIYILKVMIQTAIDYLSFNRVLALITAFLIAGGITTMIDKNYIIKYFGRGDIYSYLIASVSGAILTVCSCTIIPLFASLYKRGANLGVAITFLYSGPAINILAIFYSAALLGWDFGIYRLVAAIILGIVIGIIMDMIFGKSKKKLRVREGKIENLNSILIFFGILFLMLIVITASPKVFPLLSIPIFGIFLVKHLIYLLLLIILIIILKKYFTDKQIKSWLYESYILIRTIFPLLILGVAIAGVLKAIIPQDIIVEYLGKNTIVSNLITSVLGATMYFATLTEVPIVKALLDLGMNKGPAMALLLAGPSVSFATFLAILKIIGKKKSAVYFALVILFSTLAGYIFGFI
ncbi:permease [Methanocaldococcus indicus]|uniref:permease n=1 Tax=Methanocaldococcus indicus TaxID=213231 RepID=UPI003C6D472D